MEVDKEAETKEVKNNIDLLFFNYTSCICLNIYNILCFDCSINSDITLDTIKSNFEIFYSFIKKSLTNEELLKFADDIKLSQKAIDLMNKYDQMSIAALDIDNYFNLFKYFKKYFIKKLIKHFFDQYKALVENTTEKINTDYFYELLFYVADIYNIDKIKSKLDLESLKIVIDEQDNVFKNGNNITADFKDKQNTSYSKKNIENNDILFYNFILYTAIYIYSKLKHDNKLAEFIEFIKYYHSKDISDDAKKKENIAKLFTAKNFSEDKITEYKDKKHFENFKDKFIEYLIKFYYDNYNKKENLNYLQCYYKFTKNIFKIINDCNIFYTSLKPQQTISGIPSSPSVISPSVISTSVISTSTDGEIQAEEDTRRQQEAERQSEADAVAEADATRRQSEADATRRQSEADATRRQSEADAAAEADATRRQSEADAAVASAREATRREKYARRREEAKKQREVEEAARRQAKEAEDLKRREEAEDLKRREEAARQAAETARRAAETARRAREAEAVRRQQEETARREAESIRKQREAVAREAAEIRAREVAAIRKQQEEAKRQQFEIVRTFIINNKCLSSKEYNYQKLRDRYFMFTNTYIASYSIDSILYYLNIYLTSQYNLLNLSTSIKLLIIYDFFSTLLFESTNCTTTNKTNTLTLQEFYKIFELIQIFYKIITSKSFNENEYIIICDTFIIIDIIIYKYSVGFITDTRYKTNIANINLYNSYILEYINNVFINNNITYKIKYDSIERSYNFPDLIKNIRMFQIYYTSLS